MLTRQIWKDEQPKKIKIGATLVVWAIFIGLTSGGNAGNSGNTETSPSPFPSPAKQEEQKPTYTLEQKQEDFRKFYQEYLKRGQVLLLTKAAIIKVADLSGSKEELYLSLTKLSNLLASATSSDNQLVIPDSLKEYKDLKSANTYLEITASAYLRAIDNFQKYLDKSDLKSLQRAKDDATMGDQNLLSSSDAIDKVAKELGVDTSQIKSGE